MTSYLGHLSEIGPPHMRWTVYDSVFEFSISMYQVNATAHMLIIVRPSFSCDFMGVGTFMY